MPDERLQAEAPLFGVPELPKQALEAYARLWQFETWLRRLVYVQLRAMDGDRWEAKINASKTKAPKDNDKSLTHMPTAEDDVLSFVQMSELKRVVSENWHFFESYFPPKAIWDAKLTEIVAIRHRIAHFRSLHCDDLARITQFLRDLDSGFWRFCTSYNDAKPVLPQSVDPVVQNFLHLDLFPWCETSDAHWARIGSADPSERFTVTVEILQMPWAEWKVPIAGEKGFLYDVLIYARGQRHLDYKQLLRSTSAIHKHLVYMCFDGGAKSLRFTVPACLGAVAVIDMIEQFHEASMNCLRSGIDETPDSVVQAFADALPEYVLGPQNPLTFLSPDMPCSFFGV